MTLLIFHLFLSSFTHDGVDVMMAQKIVDWNLKRCPEGNPFTSFVRVDDSCPSRRLLLARSG